MKVGSFRQTQEPNRNAIHRKGLETSGLLRPEWVATAMTGAFSLAGTCANGGLVLGIGGSLNKAPNIVLSYQLETEKY